MEADVYGSRRIWKQTYMEADVYGSRRIWKPYTAGHRVGDVYAIESSILGVESPRYRCLYKCGLAVESASATE